MRINRGLKAKKHIRVAIFLILISAIVFSSAMIVTGLMDKSNGNTDQRVKSVNTSDNVQTKQSIKPEIKISKYFGLITLVTNGKGTVLHYAINEADAINFALNATDNGIITFSEGKYYIDKPILLKSNISLIGEEGVIFKCFYGGEIDSGDSGYSASTSLLLSDVRPGETKIHVNNTVGLNIGDYVKISDNYCISNSEYNFHSSAPVNGEIYYKNGELVKITEINGSIITINRPSYDAYLVKRDAKIRKISMLTNIEIKNIDFIGYGMETTSTAIKYYGLQNCKISNCEFTNFGDRAIGFCDCLDCVIEDNVFKRVFKEGTGYSISFSNACDNMTVINNSFMEKGRHYIAVGGQTGTVISDGMCRNLYIKNNTFENSTDEAINTHTPNRASFLITGNRFFKCLRGIEFSNTNNSTVMNNTFVDCLNGIKTIGFGSHLIEENYFEENDIACILETCSDVNISHNYITTSSGKGISMLDARGPCNITSNYITAKSEGISLENSGKNPIKTQIVIRDNKITASTEVSIGNYSNVSYSRFN